MSLTDKQKTKRDERRQVRKHNPDHAEHAARRNKLEDLREELGRLEASDNSGRQFLERQKYEER